ncbi:hypothetical protein EIP91_009577 [Steccherinum ochraceum]|uniref:MYND-type domain-containing protein n=1 Tax=Steccherinum ochraceum TaxID=92696 RepID=A0A4R0RP19_9APHY|nr:hypothetical protein EIP91_009577 [Steccherinum ochraceum]
MTAPGRVLEHVAAEIDVDTYARFGDSFSVYHSLRYNCCYSYKEESANFSSNVQMFQQDLKARSGNQVLSSAMAGNPGDAIEAGIRLWSGCTLEKNQDRAMEWWVRVALDKHSSGTPAPRRLRVHALSCLAYAQWELKTLPDDEPGVWNIDSVYRAAVFADDCVSLGFVSPIVLQIGAKIRELMKVPQIPEARHPRFKNLEFLWEAIDARDKEVQKAKQKRDTKVARAPTAYVCAAKGCGIEGTRKSALLKCAGKCPPEMKPSYCSKECQKADWKRHKPVCIGKSKDAVNQPASPTASRDITSVSDDIDLPLRTDGREVSIEVPNPQGGSTMMTTRTLEPRVLRDIRELAEQRALEKQAL